MDGTQPLARISVCQYDHLHFFVDKLQPLSHYKAIEDRLNEFAKVNATGSADDVGAAREAWLALGPSADPAAFQVHGRDLVEQMLYAFGWRITAQHEGRETRSLLLSTVDPRGARFVMTCRSEAGGAGTGPSPACAAEPDHFARSHLERHMSSHGGAQGVGVLGFEVKRGELEAVVGRYEALHPKLVAGPPLLHPDGTRVFEAFALVAGRALAQTAPSLTLLGPFPQAFAYYQGEPGSEPDVGTRLRFVERPSEAEGAAEGAAEGGEGGAGGAGGAALPLPGLEPVAAAFEADAAPAYCDHWARRGPRPAGWSRGGSTADRRERARVGEQRAVARRLPAHARGDARLHAKGGGLSWQAWRCSGSLPRPSSQPLPQVDFNAGVVAAGEAQIESTVTGNTSPLLTADPQVRGGGRPRAARRHVQDASAPRPRRRCSPTAPKCFCRPTTR